MTEIAVFITDDLLPVPAETIIAAALPASGLPSDEYTVNGGLTHYVYHVAYPTHELCCKPVFSAVIASNTGRSVSSQ